jgi:regulator of chromosome condensation
LGLGEDVPEKTRPALIAGIEDVTECCAGGMHSLCLTKDGVIWSFGCNDEGALGRDTSEEGSEFTPTPIDLPGKAIKISAGDSHSACLLDDGRVFAWGSFRDSHGNMGFTVDGNKRLPFEVLPDEKSVQVASGADHLVIMTSAGKVFTIGCGEQGQLGRVSSRTATGESRRGKTGLLKPNLIFVKNQPFLADGVWATTYCTFMRQHGTGKVFAFGLNNYNQLGIKRSNNEVESFPKLSSFKNVKKIDGGQHHTLVLDNDNKVLAIGRKEYGRLGLSNLPDGEQHVEQLTEVTALSGKSVNNVACGESISFATTADGKVYAWGFGSNNQLGLGSDSDALEPTLLTGQQVKEKKVLRVSGGGQHTLFVVEAPPSAKKEAAKKETTKPPAKVNDKVVEEKIDDKESAPAEEPAPATMDVDDKEAEAAVVEEKTSNGDTANDDTKSVASEATSTTSSTSNGKKGRKRKIQN